MKKFFALVLAVAMVLSLTACGGGNPATTTAAPQPGASTEAAKPAETTPASTASPLAGTYQIKVWAPEKAVELTKKQIDDFNGKRLHGGKGAFTLVNLIKNSAEKLKSEPVDYFD